jgi:UDP-N-acetylmuramoylalanine--D-glutamate ligase
VDLDPVTEIAENPEGRNILVVGLARSGVAIAKVLLSMGARVTGTDRKESVDGLDGVELELGGDHPELLEPAELVVLSPGVPLDAPMVAAARRLELPVVGELELAGRLLAKRSPVPLLCVTGTNGKSTTAALCAHLLRQGGREVFLGGNIGLPLAELLLREEQVDWAVVEVSSFQLEHLTDPAALVPQVAVWLNLTPDHLDRHKTMQGYAAMKRRLFEGQAPDQTGVFFLDDPFLVARAHGLKCRVTGFSREPRRVPADGVVITDRELELRGDTSGYRLDNQRLLGDHNAENAAAAVCAVLAAGAEPGSIQDGLDTYPGLPHRLEPVRELGGVRFVNDSKGTNVEATAKSLTSFDAPVILLAGGRGKGTNYRPLRPAVSRRVRHLILLGEERENLERDLDGCAEIHLVESLEAAVELSWKLAEPGEVVLLSPACASFDMFDDYAHRGRAFAELVHVLEERG